jgi:hypothetical protein
MNSKSMIILALLALVGNPALAHHSYAMFDASKTLTVTGTVAKLEWKNPHVFIWVYVPRPGRPGSHDLYAFENGSTSVLARLGWSRSSLTEGEKISVEYWPLRDGRTGGHLRQLVHADGRIARGAGGPDPTRAVEALQKEAP